MSLSCTFADHQEEASGNQVVTYTAMNFGTASSDRILVAFVTQRINVLNAVVSAVTIGGISATRIAGGSLFDNSSGVGVEAWYAAVPTGTSGNMQVDYGGGPTIRTACGLFALSGSAATPDGSAAAVTATLSTSTTLTVPTGGASMHFAIDRPNTGTPSAYSWTNSTGDFNAVSTQLSGAAHDSVATANLVVTATSNATTELGLLLSSVAWAPLSAGAAVPYNPWPQLGPMLAQ